MLNDVNDIYICPWWWMC